MLQFGCVKPLIHEDLFLNLFYKCDQRLLWFAMKRCIRSLRPTMQIHHMESSQQDRSPSRAALQFKPEKVAQHHLVVQHCAQEQQDPDPDWLFLQINATTTVILLLMFCTYSACGKTEWLHTKAGPMRFLVDNKSVCFTSAGRAMLSSSWSQCVASGAPERQCKHTN